MKNEHRDERRRADDARPAGNAARDPARQTCREDLPPERSQERCDEPARGTAVPPGANERPRLRPDEDEAQRAKGATRPLSKDPERLADER